MTTPANLRAARMRLGLTVPQAARLLEIDVKMMEILERGKVHHVYPDLQKRLDDIEARMIARAHYWIGQADTSLPFVTYSNDEVFQKFAHPDDRELQHNHIHRMMMATAQSFGWDDDIYVQIVELVPDQCLGWLHNEGKELSIDSQRQWAAFKITTFNRRDGMP